MKILKSQQCRITTKANTSCCRVPGWDSWLQFLSPISCWYCPWETVMVQRVGFLPPTWKTYIKFHVPSFSQVHSWPLWASEEWVLSPSNCVCVYMYVSQTTKKAFKSHRMKCRVCICFKKLLYVQIKVSKHILTEN